MTLELTLYKQYFDAILSGKKEGIERKKVVVDLFNDSVEVFAIKLGRILETKNIK